MERFSSIASAALIVLLVCSVAVSAEPAAETVTVQLKWSHHFQFAGFYAAVEKGFYAEEGLEVTLRERDSEKSHIQSVLHGEAQYGVADAGLLLDYLQGEDVVLLKQIFQHSPLVLLSLKNSGIAAAHDLVGRTVMVDIEGRSSAPILAMLLNTMGDIGQVQFVPQSFSLEDLTSGGFDPDAVRFDPASVLVVDDVEANRQLVSAFLSPYGLAVMEAADGEEGVEQTRTHRPNLVLMDIRMSGMDGLTATRVLKEDGETADIPIVALTASVMKEDEDEIREGFDGFLRKPVNRAALMAELARFLPHEMKETLSPEPAVPTEEAWEPGLLDEASLTKLTGLVEALESDVLPVWEGVRGTANVTAVEEFAELLARVVDGTLFPPLQSWTEKLKGQAAGFQMDLLPQTLEEFPNLVADLKQIATAGARKLEA